MCVCFCMCLYACMCTHVCGYLWRSKEGILSLGTSYWYMWVTSHGCWDLNSDSHNWAVAALYCWAFNPVLFWIFFDPLLIEFIAVALGGGTDLTRWSQHPTCASWASAEWRRWCVDLVLSYVCSGFYLPHYIGGQVLHYCMHLLTKLLFILNPLEMLSVKCFSLP